jgi:2-hydroxychromene-2-carboxylate isomerase
MTPREVKAHEEIYVQTLRRWALERAMFANAHFVGKEEVAYTADDFLGLGDREKRQQEQQRSLMMAATANANLMAMKRGDVPDDLPDWAKG